MCVWRRVVAFGTLLLTVTMNGCVTNVTYRDAFSEAAPIEGNDATFNAASSSVLRAAKIALLHQGFSISDFDPRQGVVSGWRDMPDSNDETLSHRMITTVTETELAPNSTRVVLLTDEQTVRRERHDTWWHLLWLIPVIPTGSRYETVVLSDHTVTQATAYSDFFDQLRKQLEPVPQQVILEQAFSEQGVSEQVASRQTAVRPPEAYVADTTKPSTPPAAASSSSYAAKVPVDESRGATAHGANYEATKSAQVNLLPCPQSVPCIVTDDYVAAQSAHLRTHVHQDKGISSHSPRHKQRPQAAKKASAPAVPSSASPTLVSRPPVTTEKPAPTSAMPKSTTPNTALTTGIATTEQPAATVALPNAPGLKAPRTARSTDVTIATSEDYIDKERAEQLATAVQNRLKGINTETLESSQRATYSAAIAMAHESDKALKSHDYLAALRLAEKAQQLTEILASKSKGSTPAHYP
jgi:hypothetical protein